MLKFPCFSLILIGVSCLLPSSLIFSQATFVKNIGGSSNDRALDIVATLDGGYAFAGWTESVGSGMRDAYLVNIDPFGAVIWEKTVGGGGDDQFNHLIQTQDSGYVAIGSTRSFGNGGSDMLVSRFDKNGNLFWTKTFGNTGDDFGATIIETSSGDFVIGGAFDAFTEANVIKLSSNGNLVWSKRLGGPGNDWVNDVIENNLGYLFVGTAFTFSGTPQAEAFFIQLDFNGNVLFNQSFGGTDTEILRTVQPSNTGNYLVSDGAWTWNNGDMGIWVSDITPTGNLLWSKTYGIAGRDLSGSAFPVPSGGNIIGVRDFTTGSSIDAYLIKTTNNGAIQWANAYGSTGDDFFQTVKPTNDGGFIAVGHTNSFTIGGDDDVFIVKTDALGNVTCHQSPASFVEQNVSPINTPVSPTSSFLSNANTIVPNFTNPTSVENTECIANLLPVAQFSMSNSLICPNDCIDLTNLSTNNPQSYQWTFSNAITGTSTQTNPTNICFPSPGTYNITLVANNQYGVDSVIQQIVVLPKPQPNLGADTFICDNESVTLDATTTGMTYLWSTGSTAPIITVATSGSYWVELNNGICTARDTIVIDTASNPFLNLGLDSTLCEGETLNMVVGQPNTTYLWQDGSTNPFYLADTTGIYWVEIDNGQCQERDSIDLTFLSLPILDLGSDTAYCDYETLTLNAASNITTQYQWQDGSTNSQFTPNISGTYWVAATNVKCTVTDSIDITIWDSPQIDLGKDTILCEGDTVLLDASFPNVIYSWQDNQNTSTYTATTSNLYAVTITDNNQCVFQDEIDLIFLSAQSVDLGADQKLCEGNDLVLRTNISNAAYLWQDSSTTPNFEVLETGQYTVTVSYSYPTQTCQQSDSVFIEIVPNPIIDLGSDTTLCDGDEYLLSLPMGNSYLWQNGSMDSFFTIKNRGTYYVTGIDQNQCEASDTISIDYLGYLTSTLITDTAICDTRTFVLDAYQPDATSYLWTGQSAYVGENDYESSQFLVTFPGLYQVEVANQCNTVVQDIFVEKGDCTCEPFVPNAFTPNGDGQNDLFKVYPNCEMEQFEFVVFDRWGNKVFASNDINAEWDGNGKNGERSQTGVYVWYIRYQGQDRVGDMIEHRVSGDVLLIR